MRAWWLVALLVAMLAGSAAAEARRTPRWAVGAGLSAGRVEVENDKGQGDELGVAATFVYRLGDPERDRVLPYFEVRLGYVTRDVLERYGGFERSDSFQYVRTAVIAGVDVGSWTVTPTAYAGVSPSIALDFDLSNGFVAALFGVGARIRLGRAAVTVAAQVDYGLTGYTDVERYAETVQLLAWVAFE